tara:strand:- start:10 stop:486 length:477 start_codon:yes stop_codon:yes gene_type:complete
MFKTHEDKNKKLEKLQSIIDSKSLDESSKLTAQKALKAINNLNVQAPTAEEYSKAKTGIKTYNQTSGLDTLQTSLTGMGLTPGLGIVPDIANAIISTARGDFKDAVVNLGAAVPVAGQAVGAGKLTMTAAKTMKTGSKVKSAGDLYAGAYKPGDKKIV